jgi:TATA-box binding protein (TBP) (component of TFIID and TFIIIB)
MNYTITNVKVSVKSTPIALSNVLKLEGVIKTYNNFIVLQSKYTYTIFKTSKLSENHINITKIPKLEKIEDAIENLKQHVQFSTKKVTVDNIIASIKLGYRIDLVSVCEKKLFESMKYNSDIFPGLYVKFGIGTAILFHSGRIVLVGVKNEKDLQCLTQSIFASINMLSMMKEAGA